jgi:hypothetical protein
MNRNNRKTEKPIRRHKSGFDLLISTIFKNAFPVWELFGGAVPSEELEKLEQAGDWPRGVALAVMTRLNRDKRLRKQIRDSFSPNPRGALGNIGKRRK